MTVPLERPTWWMTSDVAGNSRRLVPEPATAKVVDDFPIGPFRTALDEFVAEVDRGFLEAVQQVAVPVQFVLYNVVANFRGRNGRKLGCPVRQFRDLDRSSISNARF